MKKLITLLFFALHAPALGMVVPLMNGPLSAEDRALLDANPELQKFAADPKNWTDINGNTALHYMALSMSSRRSPERENFCEFLEKFDADINARNYAGETPLYYAQDWYVVEFLLEKGANAQVVNINNEGPLHHLLVHKLARFHEIEERGLNALPINTYDEEGYTTLHRICMIDCNWRVARMLLEKGEDPNAITKNKRKTTALHLATEYSNSKQLKGILFAHGADSTIRDGEGRTPADVAYIESATKTLVECAKNNNIGDENHGALCLLQLFGDKLKRAKQKALVAAARHGRLKFVEFLLSHGAYVHKSKYGRNLLHEVACTKYDQYNPSWITVEIVPLIALLKAHGVCINGIELEYGRTPLNVAATECGNHIRLIPLFLDQGADPNIPNFQNLIPLANLSHYGCRSIIKEEVETSAQALMRAGSRVDCPLAGSFSQALRKSFLEKLYEKSEEEIKELLNRGMLVPIQPIECMQYSCDDLKLIVCHPLPGAIQEDKKMKELRQSWFSYLCALKRLNLKCSRDIKQLLTKWIFPPAPEFINLIPTSCITDYGFIYGKALIDALTAWHLKLIEESRSSKCRSSECPLHQLPFDDMVRNSYAELFKRKKADQ